MHKDYRALTDLKTRTKTILSLKNEAININKNLKRAEEKEDYELCETLSSRLNEIDEQTLLLVETSPEIKMSNNVAVNSVNQTSDQINNLELKNMSNANSNNNSNNGKVSSDVLPNGVIKVMNKRSNLPTYVDIDHAPEGLTRDNITTLYEFSKTNREYMKMKILKLMILQLDDVRVQLGDLKYKLLQAETSEDFEKCEVSYNIFYYFDFFLKCYDRCFLLFF